jgi:hypothetical protein
MAKRKSPFSAAHRNFKSGGRAAHCEYQGGVSHHKRGGKAKFRHALGSVGGHRAIARADRRPRSSKHMDGGGPAGPQPSTLDQPGFMLKHFRRSPNVIDRRPPAASFDGRFTGAPRRQDGGSTWSEPSIFEPVSLPPKMPAPPAGSTWSPRELPPPPMPSGRSVGISEAFRSAPSERWELPSVPEECRGGRMK